MVSELILVPNDCDLTSSKHYRLVNKDRYGKYESILNEVGHKIDNLKYMCYKCEKLLESYSKLEIDYHNRHQLLIPIKNAASVPPQPETPKKSKKRLFKPSTPSSSHKKKRVCSTPKRNLMGSTQMKKSKKIEKAKVRKKVYTNNAP